MLPCVAMNSRRFSPATLQFAVACFLPPPLTDLFPSPFLWPSFPVLQIEANLKPPQRRGGLGAKPTMAPPQRWRQRASEQWTARRLDAFWGWWWREEHRTGRKGVRGVSSYGVTQTQQHKATKRWKTQQDFFALGPRPVDPSAPVRTVSHHIPVLRP